MNDLVSIIVPIYNVEVYLRQCLDSLISQTYQNLDIILVDDGSTDQSGDICDEYERKDARVRVIHKENEGLVKTRKVGLHAAIGKYCIYVDGDDWIESNAVEILTDYKEKYQADVVLGNYSRYDGGEKFPHENYVKEGLYSGDNLINDIYGKMLYDFRFHDFGIPPNVWGNLYRTDVLKEIQDTVPDCVTYGEDVAVLYFVLFESDRVGIINVPIYNYVVNLRSMTKAYHQNQAENTAVLLHYLYQKIEEIPYSDLKKQLNNYVIRIMNANFENEARSGIKNYRISIKSLKQFEKKVGIMQIIQENQFYKLSTKSKITTWLVGHGLDWLLLIYMEIKGFMGRCRKNH